MSPRIAGQNDQRGSRVKVGGALLALILLENGRQIRARISQLSANGGLLALDRPLDEGIKVTVVFHVGSTSIRSRAEMLFPMWATKGCLQPFRLRDLDQPLRAALLLELENLVNAGAPSERPDAPEVLTGSYVEDAALEQGADMPDQHEPVAQEAAPVPQETAFASAAAELASQEPPLLPPDSELALPEQAAEAQELAIADSLMAEPPPESAAGNISAAPQSAPE